MDITGIEREMSDLDAMYRPIAKNPVDLDDLRAFENLGAAIKVKLDRLGVSERAEAVLHAIVQSYAGGDQTVREAIRRLFDRYTSFRWAAYLPRQWHTAEEFRDRLIVMSAHDQGADTRDEILALQDLCNRAAEYGIDVDSILDEVAAMSSDVDRYGMGSMQSVFLHYGRHRP
ncbi:hypothetical protein Rhe02_07010 [Rhizocola hellebori]|uniref:Uncharacterized protein n=1 Tax=Rhizocola hellebori TaxID=1392758 RepID=A0A8J3VCK0_9ACTN|nr:hypothetical protein [Rhizocola hellebori]GIH02634.1 hypothetical protein Rhe02_07010 [Rhizocola hellebori]